MGWLAFFVLLVILLAYRHGEQTRSLGCKAVMEVANQRIKDLSSELQQARKDKHEAIRKQFEAERGAVAIRNSVIRDEKNHPSFTMMTLGNEIGGDEHVMKAMTDRFRAIDRRHLYAMGTNASEPPAPCSELSYADLITFVKDRPGHDQRYAIDSSKLQNDLGWTPEHTFETGIRDTVKWYLDNDWWWRPIREAKYAGERLGSAKR
jgi:hypothetical protein